MLPRCTLTMDTPVDLSLLPSFSQDFITFNADVPLKYAVSAISKTNPEYVIVNRLKDQTHYRYVFSIQQFNQYVEYYINNDNQVPLEKCLNLHEYTAGKVAEVT